MKEGKMQTYPYRSLGRLLGRAILMALQIPVLGLATPTPIQVGGPAACNMLLWTDGGDIVFYCSGDYWCDVPTVCTTYGYSGPSGETTYCRCPAGELSKCTTVITMDNGELTIQCTNPCTGQSQCGIRTITTEPQVPCYCP
jgi:hypothetical protein